MRIFRRQTTFWELGDDIPVTRVRFLRKKEHHFVSAEFVAYDIVSEHPVLIDYQQPWEYVFISSKPSDPQQLLERLSREISAYVGPWRDAFSYFNNQYAVISLVESGHGLLFRAPKLLSARLRQVLSEAGVSHNVLAGHVNHSPVKAFIAGANFVVAEGIHIEQMKIGTQE